MPGENFVTSHGTTFEFDGNLYKCMDVSHERSAPSRERLDMTTLDIAHGEEAVMVLAPIVPKRDPRKFTIAYRSMDNTVEIEEGTTATLDTADGSGTYRVTAAGLSRKTNAYVEGSATFEEVIEGEDEAGGS
jgi:hypothetical protein